MNVKELLDKLALILNKEHYEQLEKYKSLKKVLRSLKLEKEALEEQLLNAKDMEEKQDIESRLKIIVAQRKKGRKVFKALKKARKGKT